MLLKVDLAEGPYVADVGFGGHIFSAPLKLEVGIEQRTAEGTFRIAPIGHALAVETRLPAGWSALYRFTLEPAELADYEVSNWHTSTHPRSLFTNNLLAERLTPKVRVSLLNRRLIRRYPDGGTEVEEVTSPEALASVLEADFGVEIPIEWAALFAKVPAGPGPA
jgi:N-hydroxyarylamine O-acetyltransferase